MERVFYTEVQKFMSPALMAVMGIIYFIPIGILLYGLYVQLVVGKVWGDKPMSNEGLIIMTGFIMLVIIISAYLLFGSKLATTISTGRLSITFKPFIRKPIVFTEDDIERYEIRKYRPIKEYGGWGVKVGVRKFGRAYNVKGKIGLQLYLKNGKTVLLGTQREDAIAYAMKKMMENK